MSDVSLLVAEEYLENDYFLSEDYLLPFCLTQQTEHGIVGLDGKVFGYRFDRHTLWY